MSKARVFISYRRADAKYVTGRLFEHLEKRLGKENLFRDLDSIGGGADFTEAIAEALRECQTMLVLIGENWLGAAGAESGRRLDDPTDWVRQEIEGGFEREMRVIPVLLGEAQMPAEEELPESLRPLQKRQALKLRPDPDFRNDVRRILEEIPGVNPPVLYWNLGWLALILVLVLLWLLRYSDWYDGVMAVFSIVGAVVFGVLMKVLPEHRVRALRGRMEGILVRPRTTGVLGGLALTLVLGSGFFGSVRLVKAENAGSPDATIHPSGAAAASPAPLAAEVREIFWTTPWSPRALTVRVSGLPTRELELHSWELETLTVPHSFYKPALLVRSDSLLLASTAENPPEDHEIRCRITVGDTVEEGPFDGGSFFVGCGNEVGIPAEIHEDWLVELEAQESEEQREALQRFWTHLSGGFPELRLEIGDLVVIELLDLRSGEPPQTRVIGRGELTVEDPHQMRRFPQVLGLEMSN